MNSCLFIPLVVLLAYATPLLCQQTEPWKEYVYSDDGFAVSAPAEPKLETNPKHHIYISRGSNHETLGVVVMNVNGEPDEEIRGMKQTMVADPSTVPSSIADITYANNPALSGQKLIDKQRYRVRIYCVDGRLFVLEVSEGPEGERFINSFRLVEAPWKEYSYPNDGFRFSSPVEPQLEKYSSGRRYILDVPGGGFIIICMDIGPASDVSSTKAAMLQIRDGIIGREGKLRAESVLSSEFPGMSFEYDVLSSGERIRGRIYYVGATVYLVLAKGKTDAARFFSSFRIIGSHP